MFLLKKAFIKNNSAMRMEFIPPRPAADGRSYERTGVIMLEFSKAITPRKKYDWDNGIKLALSMEELSKIEFLRMQRKEIHLYHQTQPKGQTVSKNFTMQRREQNDGYVLSVSESAGENQKRLTFVLNDEEYYLFRQLTLAVIPLCLGWGGSNA